MTNPIDQTCPQIRQHLALHAGGDLEEASTAEVERHLAECADCRSELAQAVSSRERIAALGAETSRAALGHDLWPALRPRWSAERAAPKSDPAPAARAARRLAGGRGWLGAALAAAAAIAIAAVWQRDSAGPSAPPNPLGGPATEVVRDATPISAEESAGAALQDGRLRRALPGDERLRDASEPFTLQPRSREQRGSPNSLAGDDLR